MGTYVMGALLFLFSAEGGWLYLIYIVGIQDGCILLGWELRPLVVFLPRPIFLEFAPLRIRHIRRIGLMIRKRRSTKEFEFFFGLAGSAYPWTSISFSSGNCSSMIIMKILWSIRTRLARCYATCSFWLLVIRGSPPSALTINSAPEERISPVLIYTFDCDFKKKIDGLGILGARTAYPAAYAGEAVCIALNNELPIAMDAGGIAATIRIRKWDPKSARPSTLKEDAATIGASYVVAVGEPNGFAGYQQYEPSVGVNIRLYYAETGEYRGLAEETYPISLREFSNRGPSKAAQNIAASIANKLARTMLQGCTEEYPYQCETIGALRFAAPRNAYGK